MSNALEFLEDGGFHAGLAAGGWLSVLTAVLAGRARAAGRPRLRVHLGVPSVAMALLVMHARFGVPPGLTAGLALLAGSVPIRVRLGAPWPMWAGAAAAGGWLVGWQAGGPAVTWIQVLTAAMALAGGAALADFDARWTSIGLGPSLAGVTMVGVYFTVPDTREALVLLGVLVPVALAGWPAGTGRVGPAGAFAMAGMIAWVVAVGGQGRQSSIVGGLACLGLLVLEPAARRFRPERPSLVEAVPRGWVRVPAVALVHLAFVTVASRVAGLRSPEPYRPGGPRARGGVVEAVAIVAGEVVAFALLCLAAGYVAGRRRARSPNVG